MKNLHKGILLCSLFGLSAVLFTNLTIVIPAPTLVKPAVVPFKIFMEIGMLPEQLADFSESAPAFDIFSRSVDGYYFLKMNPLVKDGYWRGRPRFCNIRTFPFTLDREPYDEKILDFCKKMYEDYYNSLHKNAIVKGEIPSSYTLSQFKVWKQTESLKSIFKKLGIRTLDAKGNVTGKEIMGEEMLGNSNYSYDLSLDSFTMKKPSESYSIIKTITRVPPTTMMVYQEPDRQIPANSFLAIPVLPRGSTVVDGICDICVPFNTRILNLLGDAYSGYTTDANNKNKTAFIPPKFYVDARVWPLSLENRIDSYLKGPNSASFEGVFFEGSIGKEIERTDSMIKGVSWMLKNAPSKKIKLLVPGRIAEDLNLSQDERDAAYIKNFLDYIKYVNRGLSVEMNDSTNRAVCNPRLTIVVGSYGLPMQMDTLPVYRLGNDPARTPHIAGTVAGEVVALDQYRKRICQPTQ